MPQRLQAHTASSALTLKLAALHPVHIRGDQSCQATWVAPGTPALPSLATVYLPHLLPIDMPSINAALLDSAR